MRKQSLGLGLGLFGLFVTLVAMPGTANAGVVQCANEDDSCEVSNEGGVDWVSCACIGEGTGGAEWMDLSDEELMEVCLSYLIHCNGEGTGDSGYEDDGAYEDDGGEGDGGTGDGGTDDGGTDDGGTADGESTTEDPGCDESDGEGTTEPTGGEDDGGEGTGGEDDGGVTYGESDGESDDGGEAEGGHDEPCGCSVSGGEGTGWAAALGLLGLCGLRRRTRV
jgi:MYXO-CTERM domain-containing protein